MFEEARLGGFLFPLPIITEYKRITFNKLDNTIVRFYIMHCKKKAGSGALEGCAEAPKRAPRVSWKKSFEKGSK